MRVALDLRWLQQAYVDSPTGGLGGIGSFSRNLWNGLAQSTAQVGLVAILRRRPVAAELAAMIERTPGARVAWVGRSPSFTERRGSLRLVARLLETELIGLRSLRREPVDILHTLDHTPPPRHGAFATVVTVYDLLDPNDSSPASGKAWRRRLLTTYHRNSIERFARAAALAAISEATAGALRERFPHLANRTEVIPPGIRIEPAAVAPASAQEASHPGGVGRYFLHVGLLTARKNPVGLIEGFRAWTAVHGRNAGLVCVGPYEANGAVRTAIAAIARVNQIEDLVSIVNAVTEPALAALYRGAEALIFPSFDEGFGMPLLESLAYGTPCVASDQAVAHEAAGALGIYVDPHSSHSIAAGIERAGGTQHRTRVRREGPAWGRQFSIGVMASRYLGLYQRAAGRGGYTS